MMLREASVRTLMAAVLLSSSFVASLSADEAETRRKYETSVNKAISFLLTKGRADDGSYSSASGPAITGLVTTSLLRHGRPADEPLVAESLKFLESFIRDDGGIYQEGSIYRNYETCVSILCFKEANRDGRYDEVIANADKFVKRIQWRGERSSTAYGGAGYGKHKRPDLSNTTFLIDALKAAGNDEDSEAIQAALLFVSRTQNHESEHNTTPFATKNPDGGFYYTPAAGGQSQAGTTAAGGLRSYGSMTYAGLKSMIYAGVEPDDQRVKAALKWIQRNYDLESNPGLGRAGLYYYYHTFAKALAAIDLDEVTDADGKKHDWRAELIEVLATRQQADGSWLNDHERWLEGDPNLVTAYSLLALSYCEPK